MSLVQINGTRDAKLENQGGWDTHAKHNELLKGFLMPMMDRAFSALVTDLDARGPLDETLVVWFGEFGWEPQNIPWRRADAGVDMLSRYEVAIGDSFGFDFDLSGATGPQRPKLRDEKSKASKFPVAKGNGAPRVCGSVITDPSKVPNSCFLPLVWQTLDIGLQGAAFR